MKSVFADSLYWITLVKPGDQWAGPAKHAREALGNVVLVTTDEVLTEFLAALSKGGPKLRKAAVTMVQTILQNTNVKVVPQTRDGFLRGLEKYRNREDKGYSLTDCISMNVMIADGMQRVLTNDSHFEQEGFTVLIKKNK